MSVSSYFDNIANNAILSNNEKVSIVTSINTLRYRINKYFTNNEIKNTFCFGSYTRGTILPRKYDEDSDIDYMIIFNKKDLLNLNYYTPQTYLNQLKIFIQKYYQTSEIHQSHPTIVLNLNHIKFELVPAIEEWFSGLQIPGKNNNWISTDPNAFNQLLTEKNKRHKNLIKPAIRIVKYWNVRSRKPFESFELEREICDMSFYMENSLRDYVFSIFSNLSTSSKWANEEIERAKKIISQAKDYENHNFSVLAEQEIKKLFRLA